jgi:hypothetical protein
MTTETLLIEARQDQALKEELCERFLGDVMDQINVLDPTDDAEDLLDRIQELYEMKEGRKLLAWLLGTPCIDEWFEEFQECLDK